MKTVGSRELKNRLGRYLGLVRRGETIVVTARGRTIARLSPATPDEEQSGNLEQLLKFLEAEGHLRLAKGGSRSRMLKPIVTRGTPASRMVVEDRE
jgi:prevent-host-death family protein